MPELTAAEAKSALINLLEQSDDNDLRYHLDRLKETDPKIVEGNVAEIGPWKIYLDKKRFIYSLVSHPNFFLEYAGDFSRRDDGKWQAKVTEKTQM